MPFGHVQMRFQGKVHGAIGLAQVGQDSGPVALALAGQNHIPVHAAVLDVEGGDVATELPDSIGWIYTDHGEVRRVAYVAEVFGVDQVERLKDLPGGFTEHGAFVLQQQPDPGSFAQGLVAQPRQVPGASGMVAGRARLKPEHAYRPAAKFHRRGQPVGQLPLLDREIPVDGGLSDRRGHALAGEPGRAQLARHLPSFGGRGLGNRATLPVALEMAQVYAVKAEPGEETKLVGKVGVGLVGEPGKPPVGHLSRTVVNAAWGISTWPTIFIRFLPSACFFSNLRLRVTSPP